MLGTERIPECRRLCYNFLLGSSLGHSKSRVFQRTSILRAPIHDFYFVEVIPKLFDHLLNLVRRFKLPPNVQKPAYPGNRTSHWAEWDPLPAEGNRALPCGAQLRLYAFSQSPVPSASSTTSQFLSRQNERKVNQSQEWLGEAAW